MEKGELVPAQKSLDKIFDTNFSIWKKVKQVRKQIFQLDKDADTLCHLTQNIRHKWLSQGEA
ncbi:MAG: hypothetical protein D6767_05430 [Candidatus Hydrogenedentota bacterium]|nr:MAG: hypothetical protein D6767_05430 [Candidatus Hydrogenedentota bacterium]